ncbi:MAG TPA: hypothetical protein VK776_16745 [Bryobacteraceae bacterium]|nr:hypothetical protein [Bryobacteraceae bacterium]
MRYLRLALFAFATTLAAQPPGSLFDGLRWRMIGPFRGGRAIAATGVPGDPNIFYFGSVGGGIWKTTNAGLTWSPIFDDQHVASIGSIEVAPSDHNVIYAGTGEADIRSDLSQGDGVYKSTDAGKTWHNVGLRDSHQIGRILIHPTNPEIVYVAALGHAYGPNPERGVYRSNDGARTWQKVLDKGPDIGAVDLAFEPENPLVIYATMWQARRPPWSVYGPLEGPGSGLYKSTDGGDHWSQLTGHGLPEGPWRRSGVGVARSAHGQRVYALIDAASGSGLFRSDDAAKTWTRVGTDPRIDSRAWYFSGITIDPKNPDVVYLPNVAVYRSTDAGKNFIVLKGAPGGDDYHYLWIDPTEPARMILASDQGINISTDTGTSWSSWYNQPTAQLYHVITDSQFPYNVYGSQQDSGTAVVPSRTNHGLIAEYDRFSVGGAEAGYIAPDPKDPNIFYVSDTYGTLNRFDKRTGQGQNITPWPAPAFGIDISQRKYRFPWTAPLVFSPVDNALYYGSQYVLKTTDGGLNWQEISPDLTGAGKFIGSILSGSPASPSAPSGAATIQDAKARGYGVVYSIAPSPITAGLIWAGSDTGEIHLTRDGGKTWTYVTPTGLTDWSKITAIEASHFAAGVAYAAVDRHRLDDNKPYLFRTRDYGKTWTPITTGIDAPSFLNAIREDPVRKGLLYACTETGVFVSFDDGDRWQSLQLNLPTVSVRDLVVHGDDLVIATHGRSFWILDDMSPLRQVDSKVATSDAYLYQPATAIRMNQEPFQGTPLPPEIPKAQNPPDGAVIDYYLKSAPSGEVTLEILDAKNQLVRRFSSNDHPTARRARQAIADVWIVPPSSLTARAGMNRFVWDLRYATASGATGDPENAQAARGPQALPGAYQARLTVAGQHFSQPLKIVLDPRSVATPSDLAKQFELSLKIARELGNATDVTQQISSLRRQLADAKAKASSDSALLASIAALDTDASKIAGTGGGRNAEAPPTGLNAVRLQLNAVLNVADSADRTPPAQAFALFDQASRDLTTHMAAWNSLKAGKLSELNRSLQAKQLPQIEIKE